MTRRASFTIACVALLALAAVLVVDLLRPMPSVSPTEQAAQLEAELRCPDCQGLSVSESHTTSAAAIRAEIARQLAHGMAPSDVRAYFVARYGEWILLEPSSPAWFILPFGLVALATLGLASWLWSGRSRTRSAAGATAGDGDANQDPLNDARQRVRDEVEALDA